MKKWILFLFAILFVYEVISQTDSTNYFEGQLKLIIKDTTIYPTGMYLYPDIIDTYNPIIDSIFKHFSVTELFRAYLGENINYELLDSVYILFCDCDENELLDSLNSINQNFIYFKYINKIPESILDYQPI